MSVPVVTAPSMREPPKKQARWSCLGETRQFLFTVFIERCRRQSVNTYMAPVLVRSGMSSEVNVK